MISTVQASRIGCDHYDPDSTPPHCDSRLHVDGAVPENVVRGFAADRGWCHAEHGDRCPAHRDIL